MCRRFVSAMLATIVGLSVATNANAAVPQERIVPAPTQVVVLSKKISCDLFGSEINALLGERTTAPRLAEATAEFERGVAECMWGQQDAANEHYRNARNLLGG